MSDPWHLVRPLFLALRDELDRLVVVGGWAFRLHALHPWAQDDIQPIMTYDADLLVEPPVKANLGALLEAAGFRVERDGRTRPPIEKFYHSSNGEELEVEFLVHRTGGEMKRHGRDVTATVGEVSVQRLPHLDLLADSPWSVELPSQSTDLRIAVRVANASTFLAQKLVVLPQRRDEGPNDLRYIHDTILRFGGHLARLADLWRIHHEKESIRRRLAAGIRCIDRDLIAQAARIGHRFIPVERFAAVLRTGLERLFLT